MVLRHDAYGFHMMNIIDYLIGNTDRHWGNWGFWVINAENRLGALHPLMDFNQAFQSYNTLDGQMSDSEKQNIPERCRNPWSTMCRA